MNNLKPAPDWHITEWLNTDKDLSLSDLRGKVVVVEAFQMLCPGCVSHGLPQAKSVGETFSSDHVAIIGLHTVFEHHDAMTPVALKAFLHEYQIHFPVGVDMPGPGRGLPKTMEAYHMQGTPTLLLIDKLGRLRAQHFGHISDMRLGAEIATLLREEI